MKSLLFRQFTHFAVLKACGVDLLKSLLDKAVAAAGDKTSVKLPVLGTGKTAESDYYRDLLALFKDPERLPDGLCEVLYRIDALSTAETADRLTTLASENSIKLKNTEDPTEAEVALQIWMAKPDVFDAEYEAQKLQALRTFTHFLSKEKGPKPFRKPTAKQLAGMADALKPWFKRYGRGEDVWIDEAEIDGEWWLVIDHGERMNRTGIIEQRQRQVRRFRPEKDDVLVYNPETNAIRVCAGTIGVKRQFRNAFGETFFESPTYFAKEEVYRFEPLCEDPDNVVDHEGVAGIDSIRLVEIKYGGNKGFKEVVTRRSSDILAMYKERKVPQSLPKAENVYRVSFEVVFSGGDKKPRPVKITSRSTIQIARDCDHRIVHAWLRLKKMEIRSGE